MILSLVNRLNGMLLLMVVCAGCGGGATSSGTSPGLSTPIRYEPPSGHSYMKLSDPTAAGDANLRGIALRSERAQAAYSVRSMAGRVNRTDETVSVSDGMYRISSGGVNSKTNIITDADGGQLLKHVGLGAGYEFMQTFEGHYTVSGKTYDLQTAIIGTPTEFADIPKAGRATYTGKANLLFVSEQYPTRVYSGGSVTAVVNFDTQKAFVNMGDFTVSNTSGHNASGTFDRVQVNNMTVYYTDLTGGDVVFKNGTETVFPLGAGVNNKSQGMLFGFDPATGNPDEIGGIVFVKGESGEVTGAFAAD